MPVTGLGPSLWMVAIALIATGLLVRRIPRQHRARVLIALVLSTSFFVSRTSRADAASSTCSATTTAPATVTTVAPTT
ncbi:MAG: hypothetical protein ACKOYL_07420, partial [Actinomycetota bacterium]